MKNNRFLITGSSGQLGKEFQAVFFKHRMEYAAPAEAELDILNPEVCEKAILSLKPTVLLNCAAYNAVDQAEVEPEKARRINSHAVGHLAGLCKKHGILLVHFGSDYVFDGEKGDYYTEEDKPNPLNVYGQSKLEGERAVQNSGCDHLIFRLSWVIGPGKQNFLYKLSEWAKEKKVLKISADEVSVPTYTEDIVSVVDLAVQKGARGLYHFTNSDHCSRYELARFFLKTMGLKNLVIPVPSSSFNIKTKRPLFSAMSNGKISKELGITIHDWRDGVERYSKRLKSS